MSEPKATSIGHSSIGLLRDRGPSILGGHTPLGFGGKSAKESIHDENCKAFLCGSTDINVPRLGLDFASGSGARRGNESLRELHRRLDAGRYQQNLERRERRSLDGAGRASHVDFHRLLGQLDRRPYVPDRNRSRIPGWSLRCRGRYVFKDRGNPGTDVRSYRPG